MLKHQSERPLSLKNATGGKEFHPMLERVVAAMLAKAPADRYQNMATAAQDLKAIIDGVEAPQEVLSSSRVPSVKLQEKASAPPAVPAWTQRQEQKPGQEPRQMLEPDQDKTVLVQQPSWESPARQDFAPHSFESQTPTRRMKDAPSTRNNPAPSTGSASSFSSVNAVHSIRSANQDDPEDNAYEQALPSHFLRLMVGSFIVIIVLMAAIGYWWIQPSTSAVQTTSPLPLELSKQQKN
jgi:hypothetical protein